ncbi:TetR/AcrR family transcriptional regulator [Chitinophagaceae bacterium LWZ2-11]
MKPKDDNKIEEIYKSTLALVKREGLSGITMSMIAKHAGLATGTVYLYFKNKEELIVKLFDVCVQAWLKNYFADLKLDGPFKPTFKTIWMNMAKHNLERFDEVVFVEQCFHSPFISEDTRILTKQMFEPIYNFMERGKKEKLVKPLDTVWLYVYMRGIIKEMVKYAYYNKQKLNQKTMDELFDLCWDGMKD